MLFTFRHTSCLKSVITLYRQLGAYHILFIITFFCNQFLHNQYMQYVNSIVVCFILNLHIVLLFIYRWIFFFVCELFLIFFFLISCDNGIIWMHVLFITCIAERCYIYICMYVCIYMCVYIYIYIYIYICMYVYMYVCVYMCIYMCVYVYMYIYIYVCMYVYIYVYMYIYICVYIYVYVYICICICIYMYMYIYIYIYIKSLTLVCRCINSTNIK